MLPIVIRTTDEMLRLVPAELREGSIALGSRQARTIVRIVLPAAAPGIVSGALLAVARAAGETAPLLFVLGPVYKTNRSLFHGANTTLSVQIFQNASSPFARVAAARVGRRTDADRHRVHLHRARPRLHRDLLAPHDRRHDLRRIPCPTPRR